MGVRPSQMFCRSVRTIALAAALCAPGARAAVAQPAVQLKQNALRLVVVNDHDIPVPLAEVTIRQGPWRAAGRTDSAGIFRVEGILPGNWQTSVRRIGYNEAVLELPIAAGENAFTVTVDVSPATLKDVNVVEKGVRSLRLVDYEKRKARGEPSAVITREQIEKRNPISLSQMFRGIPGLQVADEQGMKYPVAARGSVPAGGFTTVACPMRVAVDGILRPPLTNLDDVNPSDVHGVEVYYGPASLPLQLANFRTNNWCGLVVIWTKDR